MAATLVGRTANVTEGTALTLSLPGGTAEGDLAILCLTGNVQPVVVTSGFTEQWADVVNDAESLVATKLLDATDISNGYITYTNTSALRVVNYLEVWTDADFGDIGTATTATASPATLPTASIPNGDVAVMIGVYRSGTTAGTIGSYPVDYTGQNEEAAARLTVQTGYWANTLGSLQTSPSGTATLGGTVDTAMFMVLTVHSVGLTAPGVADALIEVDVTNDPRSGVTTWTDITSYARGTIDITRGRQDELSDQLAPATCTLTLNNNDGRFTPDLTTGAYGTGFRKGIQIRVSVDLDGTTYRRFRGYVDTIDGPQWPGGVTEQSFVSLTCSDELAQWSKGRKFKDVLTETILRDNPDAYYPLTDGSKLDESGNDQKRLVTQSRNGGGSIKFKDGINKREAEILANILNGVTRDIDPESSPSRNWKGGSFKFNQGAQGGHNYLERTLDVAASDRWALGAWVRCSRDTDGDGGWVVFLKNGTRYLGIGYNGTGEARASVYDATSVANVTGPRLTNNDWHHIFVHYDRAANIELYVDGRSKGTITAENWDNSGTDHTLWIGSGQYNGSGNYSGIARGNVAHVAVYSGDNADDAQTNIADHYEAGWSGFSGARTGEMLDRVVGWMQYPGSTAIDNGLSTVGDGFAQGSTALEYAQLLIDSEAGSLYTRGDGTLVFHERSYRYDNTTDVFTVSSYHDTDTGFRTDDQYLVNRARYNMPNGGRGVANNATSVADYGPYQRDVETLLRNEYAAEDLARFMVFRLKTPAARLLSFPVDILTRPTSLGVAALGVEIDDRVRMTNLPSQAKDSTVRGFVEGWSETIGTPDQPVWTITFNTSPTYLIDDYLILNSATEGQLNEETLSY